MNPKVQRDNGIYYIEVSGTPYEVGLQHGTALKQEIQESVADYKSNVSKMFGEDNGKKIIDWALSKTKFKVDLEKHVPDLVTEAKGIANGAEVTLDDILMLGMYEEVYEAGPHKIGVGGDPEKSLGHGCSAFTIFSGGKRFSGQNMDYSENLLGKQMIIKADYGDLKMLRYGFVGNAGGTGVNNHGLSIWVTTLPQGQKRDDDGVGGDATARALLESKSVDEAVAKLRNLPRFGTLSYTITDPKKGVIVEASADEFAVREMTDKEPFLVHTNHLLKLKKRNDMPGLYEDGEPVFGSILLTVVRKKAMEMKIRQNLEAMSVEALQGILIESPNNIYNHQFMTLLSSVVEIDGDQATLHVSAGYDPMREWNRYSID